MQTLTQMNLLEKLEKLGLDDVNQECSTVTPTALMAALENLNRANCAHAEDMEVLAWSKCNMRSLTPGEANNPMRRNLSNSSVEAMASPKMSPMHRSSSVGLNMICDLGSPPNSTSMDIRAKFQVV